MGKLIGVALGKGVGLVLCLLRSLAPYCLLYTIYCSCKIIVCDFLSFL